VIRVRLALWVVLALATAAAASCGPAPAASNEELAQTVEELRGRVALLERTVARLEQELAEARASPPPPAPVTQAAPTPAKPAVKVQCAGATKAGARCKRPTSEGSRYCWQHAAK
jgi:hypothetical protein